MFVVIAVMRAVVVSLMRLSDNAGRCEGHEAGEKTALDEDSYIFHVFSSVFKTLPGYLSRVSRSVRERHSLPSVVPNSFCQ
jgi:hypothetical protein